MVSGCCCKEVYRYPHNNKLLLFPTPLVLATFLGSSIPTSLFIFKMFFFVLVYVVFVQYSKRYSKNIRFKNRNHANMAIYLIISTRTSIERTSTVRAHA